MLVRRDSRPSQSEHIIAAQHRSKETVWAEWNPPPLIIADKRNERKWVFLDLDEDDIGEIQPIGVVEAVLTPVTSTFTRDQVQ